MAQIDHAIIANSPLGYAESVVDLRPHLSDSTIRWTHRPLALATVLFTVSIIVIGAIVSLPFLLPGPRWGIAEVSILIAGCVPGIWCVWRGYRMLQWREELRIELTSNTAVFFWARGGRDPITLEAPVSALQIAITEVRHRNGYQQIGVIAQLERAHFAIYRGKSFERARAVLNTLKVDLHLPESVFADPLPPLIKPV